MKKLILSLFAATAVLVASAQDVTSLYNAAAAAYGQKKFDVAAENFDKVIEMGMDDESAASMVATAKTYLPKCYYMLGGGAMKGGNYEAALTNFTKSAEYAELYDDMATQAKANQWIGKLYQTQGGDAFNNKDYEKAKKIFEIGYASNPRNTEMANWLAICYCETAEFEKGMEIFQKISDMGKKNPKYEADGEEARKNMAIYTNNRVAEFQAEANHDGVIAMAEWILATDPTNALAEKIRLQAYYDKKDHAAVTAAAEAAAAAQTSEEEKSNIYFILGASYNDREMTDQAVAAFKKVTAGPNAEIAAASVAELTKK